MDIAAVSLTIANPQADVARRCHASAGVEARVRGTRWPDTCAIDPSAASARAHAASDAAMASSAEVRRTAGLARLPERRSSARPSVNRLSRVAPLLHSAELGICGLAEQAQRDRTAVVINWKDRRQRMLETIAIILIVLWLLGVVSGYTSGLLHSRSARRRDRVVPRETHQRTTGGLNLTQSPRSPHSGDAGEHDADRRPP